MNKKLLLIFVVLLVLPMVSALSGNWTYTGFNFSVTEQESLPRGLFFTGTHFYILGTSSGTVYEYDSTGSYTGFNFSVDEQEDIPYSVVFTGTYFYIVGTNTDTVYEYDSVGIYTGFNFSVAGQDDRPQGLSFNGTHFHIMGKDTNTVYEYNSTGSYTGFNFNVGEQESQAHGLYFTGTYFYIIGYDTDTVYEYNSTGNYTGFNFSVGEQEIFPGGLFFSGVYFYIVGFDTDTVYEYKISDIYISDCGELNTAGATYTLNSDIINRSILTCMNITKSDITLDCQGHLIQGNNSGSEYGVHGFGAGIDNIIIKNCNISGWLGGIRAYGWGGLANNWTIINNTITNPKYVGGTSVGIYFSDNSNGLIENNIIHCNSSIGCLYLQISSNYNIIRKNTITNFNPVVRAISLTSTTGNIIYNNLINGSVLLSDLEIPQIWNTSKQIGTRVYSNGTYIGGNYWTNLIGTGYSDTCTDSIGDGFCDNPLNITTMTSCIAGDTCGDDVDYFPLSNQYNTPIITLISPEDNSFTIDTTPDFSFNVVDINETSTFSCTLYIDSSPYGTNSSVDYGVITNIIPNASLSLNNHTWYLTCYNGYTIGTSSSRNITIITVGLCNATLNHTVINFTYYDEINDSVMNATNTYDLTIWDGTYYYNQTGAFINANNNRFCTNLDPALAVYNWNMWGSFTLSADGYITRIMDINEDTPIAISNSPYTNYSFYLISISNSSTVTYNWLTTNFDVVDGTMRIYRCNDDGSRSLVESLPIISGVGSANLQLLVQAYSYDITIDGILYQDFGSYSTCHIEAATDVTLYVDLGEVEIAPQIGLAGVVCTLTKVLPDLVRMVWTANPEDSSAIEGCIIAYRRTIYGNVEVYHNCTSDVYNRTVAIPMNANEYIVMGKLIQSNFTVICGDNVFFSSRDSSGGFWGTSGLLASFFLVAAMILIFAGRGEFMIMGGIIGIIAIAILGITNFDIPVISSMIVLLIIVLFVGRYSRKVEH